jgi:hypothetical protein
MPVDEIEIAVERVSVHPCPQRLRRMPAASLRQIRLYK